MIRDTLEDAETIYISIDMDAIDPSEAPQ